MLPTPSNLAKEGLRRVDHLPSAAAWAAGIALGAVAGLALAGAAPLAVGGAGFLLLLGLAGWLVRSGEPVGVQLVEAPPERPALVELVEIPAGRFRMGSPQDEQGRWDDEGPVHEVTLSAFACMKFPVTRKLYAELAGTDPGWPEGEADDRPANNVSWRDAVAFCNLLSEKEGREPCYRIDGEEVAWHRAANGYRLATEAEWEYACRAGTTTRWSFGDDEARLPSMPGSRETRTGSPGRWDRRSPTLGGSTTCTATSGNGAGTASALTSRRRRTIPRDRRKVPAGRCGGAPSSSRPGSCAPRTGTGSSPRTGTRIIGFRCVRAPRRQP